MSRVEFMNQLKNLLWDIPEGEREEALNYYEAVRLQQEPVQQ